MYRAEDELLDKLILSDQEDNEDKNIQNKIVDKKNLNIDKKIGPSGSRKKPDIRKKNKIEKKDEGKKTFWFFSKQCLFWNNKIYNFCNLEENKEPKVKHRPYTKLWPKPPLSDSGSDPKGSSKNSQNGNKRTLPSYFDDSNEEFKQPKKDKNEDVIGKKRKIYSSDSDSVSENEYSSGNESDDNNQSIKVQKPRKRIKQVQKPPARRSKKTETVDEKNIINKKRLRRKPKQFDI